MFSVDLAVEYLTKRKYSFNVAMTKFFAGIDKDNNSQAHKELAEINAYKDSLRSMSESELEKLFIRERKQELEKRAKDEAGRIYNLKQSNADFVHWSKAAHWSIDEALALSFGKEPELVNWQSIKAYQSESVFVKAYAKRRDLALRAIEAKKVSDPVSPMVFISWALELHIDLPSELLNELEKLGNTAIDWRKEWLKLKAAYDLIAKQKPDNTQQTENLLQAIACMAMDGYGLKLEDKKSSVPTEISNALKRHEKAIDRKTIKAWIDKGISLLPRKPF